MDQRYMALVFFAMLALCALVTKAHVSSWNDGSRIATVDALTANHSFQIDGSPYATGLGDAIRIGGRTYSDKPPLLALLAAAVVSILAPFGVSLRQTPGTAIYLMTLGTVGVAFAAGCTYAYAFQRALGCGARVATAVAVASGVATLELPYATVLTNHVPCGAAGLAGCYYLYRGRSGRQSAVAGVCLGLAYAFDAAAIVFAVAAAALLWRQALRSWLLCLGGALPLLLAQFGFNEAISGSILPTTYNLAAWRDPTLPLHTFATTQVLRLFTPLEYARFLGNLLVGVRGIISYTPMVLVAAYGFGLLLHAGARQRALAIAATATFAVYVLLIVFLQNDMTAQNFGERRYADLFFLLCTGLGPALASARSTVARATALVLIALSVASAGLGTVAPFAGQKGEWGFVFAAHELAMLQRRAPIQAALDAVLLVLLIAIVLRLTARAMPAA